MLGAILLSLLDGGKPRAQSERGLASILSLSVPLRDRNFLMFLYTTGTQMMLFLVVSIFLVLFFKERLALPAGQLVFMSSFALAGGAAGSFAFGWLADRFGTRSIRIGLQLAQVVLLLAIPFVHSALPGVDYIAVGIFAAFGFMIGGSITAGNVYMLNYVPLHTKESYMALAYSIEGAIAGSATFAAGLVVYWLGINPLQIFGLVLGAYEALFAGCALMMAASAIVVVFLKE